MSILIKGMEMPEYGCSTCPMCVEAGRESWWVKYKCVLLNELVVTSTCKRDKNCPLVEQKTGVWIRVDDDEGITWMCSECGDEYFPEDGVDEFPKYAHYCPNCGADMRGEATE